MLDFQDRQARSGVHHRPPVMGYVLAAIGLVTGLIGLALFALGFAGGDAYSLFFLLGALIVLASVAIVKRGRRYFVRSYEVSEPHAFQDCILYLRPFMADESPGLFFGEMRNGLLNGLLDRRQLMWAWLALQGVSRYEELLAYAFRRVGTFIVIGNPKEKVPLLGATRIYSRIPAPGRGNEEAWKMEVEQDIAAAQLVLVHIGVSQSVMWEIEKVVRIAAPQRVVLCVNPVGKWKTRLRSLKGGFRAQLEDAWSQFRNACGAIFPHALPETIGDARFVRFDADWSPKPVQPIKRKIAWFMLGHNDDLSRRTTESALAWATWMLIPEPLARWVARFCINYGTFLLALLLAVVVLTSALDYLYYLYH